MKILFFGQLSDITGEATKIVANSSDINSLQESLYNEFPTLKNATFRVAVNNKIVNENLVLTDTDEIAFLPPFAGG